MGSKGPRRPTERTWQHVYEEVAIIAHLLELERGIRIGEMQLAPAFIPTRDH